MELSSTELKSAFESAGQGHVFRFWDTLSEAEQSALVKEAAEIDLQELQDLIEQHITKGKSLEVYTEDDLAPAPYIQHPLHDGDPALWTEAGAVGEAALRDGRVAAFTVAGGQGTRLGFDGPKGTFPVTPVTRKSLFQVFAEKILAAQRRYENAIPWFVMTSQANHAETEHFFKERNHFGLNPANVIFFQQGRMPAIDAEGKIMLAGKGQIAMSPDGHGGALRALVRSGAVEWMRERGIDVLSYFQVDNPLVRCIDPEFVGFHLMESSEMSSKMIPKAYPEEKVGHFCRQKENTVVVEYSDMPESLQMARDAEGHLKFNAGSIAIHLLDVEFIQKTGGGELALPFHRAHKKVPTIDDSGNPSSPEEPNGLKFEMFVFDALPHAQNPVIIETLREDEFSPVKNAEGVDSPASAEADQLKQFARWAIAAGEEIEVDEAGVPHVRFEISPLFADTQDLFVEKWKNLDYRPAIENGTVIE